MIKCICKTIKRVSPAVSWLQALALLGARFWIARVFFMSGLTKIGNRENTLGLFADEYKVPFLPPEVAAVMGAVTELSMPVFLILGLLTPLAALALMGMSLVIELFVYPGTTEHYYWILLTALLATHGSGKLGLDYWVVRKFF